MSIFHLKKITLQALFVKKYSEWGMRVECGETGEKESVTRWKDEDLSWDNGTESREWGGSEEEKKKYQGQGRGWGLPRNVVLGKKQVKTFPIIPRTWTKPAPHHHYPLEKEVEGVLIRDTVYQQPF